MSILNDEMMAPYKNAKRDTFHTAAVGVTFRNKEHVEAVETGDFALLSPEFDNEHDATAVAIIHSLTGNKIGYIKRELNSEIWHNIIKKKNLYIAKIERTGGTEPKPNIGFNLSVMRLYHDDNENAQ